MDILTLIILAGVALVILMLPVMVIMILAPIALTIFIWRKVFPFGWGIAEWTTTRRNFIPFVLFLLIIEAILVILFILAYLFAVNVHWLGLLVMPLIFLALAVTATILSGGLGLAIILWIVRLSHGGYARFRGGFWRVFQPIAPPTYPLPPPLTNPSGVAPPPVERSTRRRRRRLVNRRKIIPNPLAPPTEEKTEVKTKAKARAGEKAKAQIEVKKAKAQTKTETQAKAGAEEKAKEITKRRRRRRLRPRK
jgi:hypothetical protein